METANASMEGTIATAFATKIASTYSNAYHEIHSESHSKSKIGRCGESHDVAIRSIDDGNNVNRSHIICWTQADG